MKKILIGILVLLMIGLIYIILTKQKLKEITQPNHYKNDNIEDSGDVIDFCHLYDLNFTRGNIVKYVTRAGKKDNELHDLEKALEYLKREIAYVEFLNEKD